MTTIAPTYKNNVSTGDYSVVQFSWALTSANPQGAPISFVEWADVTWSATGTWGGATLKVQGSNDGTNFAATGLSNAAGGAEATATGDKIFTTVERPLSMQPILTTVGAGATITVTATLRRANPLRQ